MMMSEERDSFSVSNAHESGTGMSLLQHSTRILSGRSNRSFKHLVRMLGPALKVHLGVNRKAKVCSIVITEKKILCFFHILFQKKIFEKV